MELYRLKLCYNIVLMAHPEFSAIVAGCPVLQRALADPKLVRVVRMDQWEEGVGYAECVLSVDIIALVFGIWGCRNVTAGDPTGCPLRQGVQVKVVCPSTQNTSSNT